MMNGDHNGKNLFSLVQHHYHSFDFSKILNINWVDIAESISKLVEIVVHRKIPFTINNWIIICFDLQIFNRIVLLMTIIID